MNHPFLHLPEDVRGLLFQHSQKMECRKNEILLREGQVCRHIYYIQQGMLRTFHNKDGKEINLHFANEDQFTTDLQSIRTGAPATVTIKTYEPSVVYVFEQQTLSGLYRQSEAISRWSRALLEQMLAEQEAHSRLFQILSSAQRYHHLAQHRPDLLQRVSLTQLASYLGLSRESISRIRRG